jgi:hypothetical protein
MREIYFHEDDYCQQQLLPREATSRAESELQKIGEFSKAHRDPDGAGWTDVYVREEGPLEFVTLKMKREELAAAVKPYLPPFDVVYTGYSSYRTLCENTAAWGNSSECVMFADWDENGIVCNVWVSFFEREEKLLLAASKAVAALGKLRPLVYVDWAWDYTCETTEEETFLSKLRSKLDTIAAATRK